MNASLSVMHLNTIGVLLDVFTVSEVYLKLTTFGDFITGCQYNDNSRVEVYRNSLHTSFQLSLFLYNAVK